MLKSQDMQLFN